MAMKTAAQKTAEMAMWTRIAEALPEDAEVQDLCASMLAKYAPTSAELFALALLDALKAVAERDKWYSSKEIAELCGVGATDSRRVTPALRRLVGDGKVRKQDADKSTKVCMYQVVA